MIRNFFKTAIRALIRRKMHSFINILGLTIGMTATLLIVSYVFFELSYDKFNENYKNTYRIYSDISLPNGNGVSGPATVGDLAPKLEASLPSVTTAVRVAGYRNASLTIEENTFSVDKMMWVDSSYFQIFTHKFIVGNPKTALNEPYCTVLTEDVAIRLYGTTDALGKTYKHGGDLFKITGVVENIPLNSHIKFEFVASISSVITAKRDITQQGLFNFMTYMICQENANLEEVETKIDELVNETVTERIPSMGITSVSTLQPLKDIHLKSKTFFELEPAGDLNNVYIFAALAIFIILIAIVNFVNLVTANSETRAKEIGLRKVMGAFRKHLFFQFIGEAILVSMFSFLIALGLAELFIGSFRELMDTPVQLPYWNNPLLLVFILLGVGVIGFISGSYPALYLSKLIPVKALKGSKSSSHTNVLLRKLLVVFQFTIAIFLLINLALLFTQVNYMKNKDLGFDKERVMIVENFSNKIRSSFESIKADLLMNPHIESVVASQGVPGEVASIEGMHKMGDKADNSIVMNENRIQYDFFKTYGIEMKSGRVFSEAMGTESGNVIMNETAVKELGIEDPLHKKVIMIDDTLTVIGICKDYHFKSLHHKIEPLAFRLRTNYFNYVSIKFNSDNYTSSIRSVEEVFRKADPNMVFDYSFMDQRFAEMYAKEDRTNKLITSTSILAIIISMLGLFALTSFTISQKFQEIGIRKVMGASIYQVVSMFVKNLTQWVLVAAVIAIPISYYSMNKWLDQFVFHTEVEWWMFAFGAFMALIIAVLTVGLLANKAAKSNPVDALKYE